MAKLLPPIIQGKLPAQAQSDNNIKIPYKLNPAVGIREFDSIYLKLKSVSTGVDIGDPIQTTSFSGTDDKGNYIANFSVAQGALTENSYYKAQIAFARFEEVGYYSSVGVFKYGDPGEAIIENLIPGSVAVMPVFLRGRYINEDDTTEKAKSYQFTIYNSERKAIERSEELIDPYYEIKMRPKQDATYYVVMTVSTINGFIVKSVEYSTSGITMNPLKAEFTIIPIIEEGTIKVVAKGDFKGTYQLEVNERPVLTKTFVGNSIEYIDRNCEQGVEYEYTLYKLESSGQFSEAISSEPITIDFEDVFLHDGEKAVCIRYNPKISSFKTTLLENKQEALGNKYPYFFRNGSVEYKEFTIGGLISRLSDLNGDSAQRLSTNAKDSKVPGFATNLSADNFKLEREYKLELLDWLNNGKIKMFRSPAEGNYCVRLMNVSLQPQETLGRMLHSFTCTAYEAADIDYFNQKEVASEIGLIDIALTEQSLENPIELDAPGAYAFIYEGAKDDILTILYNDGEEQKITIGDTGTVSAEEIKYIIRFSSTNVNSKISYWAKKYNMSGIPITTMVIEEYKGEKVPVEGLIRVEIYADEKDLVDNYTNSRSVGDLSYTLNGTVKSLSYNDNIEGNNNVEVEVATIAETINSLSLGANVKARVIRKVSVDNATTN